ncbi:MAG: AIR synthase-related protein, partial [bacterium]
HAAHLAQEARLSAATDVTGFGLLGHLWEMASRSGVSVQIDAGAVPFLPGALECSKLGVHTGGEGRNRDWVGTNVTLGGGVDPDVAALLFDPQTSGGLLLAASPRKARILEAAFARDGVGLWRIGRARPGNLIRVE